MAFLLGLSCITSFR